MNWHLVIHINADILNAGKMEELLGAGDVLTINVQHIESLNDIVEALQEFVFKRRSRTIFF